MSDTEVWPFCFEFFFMKLNHSAAVCGTLSSFFQLMFVIWILRRGNYKWVNSIVKKNSLIFRWFVIFCTFVFDVFVFHLFDLLKLVILIVSVFHCACIICFLFTNSSPYAGSTSFKRKPYRFNCFERFMHSSMYIFHRKLCLSSSYHCFMHDLIEKMNAYHWLLFFTLLFLNRHTAYTDKTSWMKLWSLWKDKRAMMKQCFWNVRYCIVLGKWMLA